MSQVKQARQALQSIRQTGLNAEADSLLERARDAQAEQVALLEVTPLESQYTAVFAALVEAKHDQAARIGDKLENLIEQQAARLQVAQSQRPGLFALASKRAKWEQQIQQQQSTLQRLQGRLETVREIKEGMDVHGPRIEELATRKLRAQAPELARDWDGMQEARRLHEVLQRKEKKRALEREQKAQLGRGLHLGMSQER